MTRRHCLLAAAGLAQQDAPLTAAYYHARRRLVRTSYGRIAYIERGSGPVAVFLHGLPLNIFQWRTVLPRLSPYRRCLAPDFLGLGYTQTRPDQDLSPAIQADMIAEFLHALSVSQADVVSSDSGGAVAQLLTVRHPLLVRNLLLNAAS